MPFRKLSEQVIRPKELSYFKVREFAIERAVADPIAYFMQSRYFLWKEEYHNSIEIGGREGSVDWNFHGLYDAKKLGPNNFVALDFEDFKRRFIAFIVDQIGRDPTLKEIELEFDAFFRAGNKYFLLEDVGEEYFHEWTVFDFFLSGFVISSQNQKLYALEFGLD